MSTIPNLISVKEFTDLLSSRTKGTIGEAAIYQMIKSPGFPALLIGNRYFILIDKVEAWFESQYARSYAMEPVKELN